MTNREAPRALILDLKLPGPKLIRRQRNRDRFANAIVQARTHMLRNRERFRESKNRLRIMTRVELEINETRLAVVFSKATAF